VVLESKVNVKRESENGDLKIPDCQKKKRGSALKIEMSEHKTHSRKNS